jgi:hypothetical protein
LRFPSTSDGLVSLRFPPVEVTLTAVANSSPVRLVESGNSFGTATYSFDTSGNQSPLAGTRLIDVGLGDAEGCTATNGNSWTCVPIGSSATAGKYPGTLTLNFPSAFADYESATAQSVRDVALTLVAVFAGVFVAGLFFLLQWMTDRRKARHRTTQKPL